MYKYISLNLFFLFTIPQEIRLKLGFKLRLTDLLIKPIQRLTKYHMLLEAIVKYSQRAGCTEEAEALSKAFHVMTVVPNQANDMMDIGRLQGFEGNIYNLNKYLAQQSEGLDHTPFSYFVKLPLLFHDFFCPRSQKRL